MKFPHILVVVTSIWHISAASQFALANITPDSDSAFKLQRKKIDVIRHPLVFSPDGRLFAGQMHTYRGQAKGIGIWDLKTGRLKTTFKTHEIDALAFAQSDKNLLIGSGSQFTGTISLWKLTSGKRIKTLAHSYIDNNGYHRGNLGPVQSMALSPNGKTIAVGTQMDMADDWSAAQSAHYEGHTLGKAELLDAKTGRLKCTLQIPELGMTALAFSADGRRIAVGGDNGSIRICSVVTGRVLHKFKWHSREIAALAFQGQRIISVDRHGIVVRGDTRSGRARQLKITSHAHNDYYTSFAFSSSGKILAYACESGALKFIRLK